MTKRICLEPGCSTLTPRTRCPAHAQAHETQRTRQRRTVRPYSSAERTQRRAYLDWWLATAGPWCVGWDTQAPHLVDPADLTADHVTPVSMGGPEDGPMQAMCRSCNACKGRRQGSDQHKRSKPLTRANRG